MKFDIGKVGQVEGLLPWDLTLTLEGREYPTRRPTIGEVAHLERLHDMKNAEGMALVTGILFAEPRPDLGGWTVEDIIAAIAAFIAYFNARAAKNSGRLAETVREAINRETAAQT